MLSPHLMEALRAVHSMRDIPAAVVQQVCQPVSTCLGRVRAKLHASYQRGAGCQVRVLTA
jgi:hypothetical protein